MKDSSRTFASSRSAPALSLLTDEAMGQSRNDCFPEVLARDLELSKAIFAARNMTAGAPAPSVSSDEHKIALRNSLCYNRAASPMSYHSASARIQSLGPIQERSSVASFADCEGGLPDMASDTESSSEPYSGVMGAPSISFPQYSITTTGTSIAPDSRKPSPNDSRLGLTTEFSWMDGDSDDDVREDQNSTERLGCLSPRPPTRQDWASNTSRSIKPRENGSFHSKSCSTSCVGPLILESRSCQHFEETPNITKRTSSLRTRHNSIGDPTTVAALMPISPLQLHPINIVEKRHDPIPRVSCRPGFTKNTVTGPGNITVATEPSPISETYPEDDDHFPSKLSIRPRPETIYIQPSPPPSPLPSVQTWLYRSTQPYASQLPTDELAKVVPLPPDVIETLRVSIACFPETMLLSSSLTVETIRAYSRKVRHPSVDSTASSVVATPQTSRKSIWKKVVSYRRGSISERKVKDSHSSTHGTLRSPSSSSLDAPKPWASLKNVFGNTSDYMCDALYAHIIAYNYISALVPQTAAAAKVISRRHSCGVTESQQDDIPKKAASVLGLAGSDASLGGIPGYVKHFGSSLVASVLNRDEMGGSQVPSASSYENAIKDIKMGLMRCIARLIATARLVAESGKGEDRMVEMEAHEVDVLLLRSLCEIVKMSEEAASVA